MQTYRQLTIWGRVPWEPQIWEVHYCPLASETFSFSCKWKPHYSRNVILLDRSLVQSSWPFMIGHVFESIHLPTLWVLVSRMQKLPSGIFTVLIFRTKCAFCKKAYFWIKWGSDFGWLYSPFSVLSQSRVVSSVKCICRFKWTLLSNWRSVCSFSIFSPKVKYLQILNFALCRIALRCSSGCG
jgi:hypothetical protein